MIWGSLSAILVTFSCLEKMSGISSTPTMSDFAVTNGEVLKARFAKAFEMSLPCEPTDAEA